MALAIPIGAPTGSAVAAAQRLKAASRVVVSARLKAGPDTKRRAPKPQNRKRSVRSGKLVAES